MTPASHLKRNSCGRETPARNAPRETRLTIWTTVGKITNGFAVAKSSPLKMFHVSEKKAWTLF